MNIKPFRTPARENIPRKAHPNSAYYGMRKESTEGNAPSRRPFSQPVYNGWTEDTIPLRVQVDSVYYSMKKHAPEFYGKYWSEIMKENPEMQWYPIEPDDTVKTVGKQLSIFNEQTPEFNEHLLYKIMEAFSLSAQELGVTNQSAITGTQPWLSSTPIPLWSAADPMLPAVEMPIGFDGWTEADFIDRREMFALMETGQAWSYAQCIWLQNKAEQFEKDDLDHMFPGGVHKWHFYARTHCPRYKAEQPRYIQQRDTQDNAS